MVCDKKGKRVKSTLIYQQKLEGTSSYQDDAELYSTCKEVWLDENKRLHRENGPAVIRLDNSEEYWIQGNNVTKTAFSSILGALNLVSLSKYLASGEAGEEYIARKKAKEIAADRGLYVYEDGSSSRVGDPKKNLVKIDFSAFSREDLLYLYASRERWLKDGQVHREDGPAIITPDAKGFKSMWYRYDKQHREDGPALIFSNGKKQYWVDGEKIRIETMQLIQNETSKEKLASHLISTSGAERWLAKKRMQNLT